MSHEIISMQSIIKLISCNRSIGDEDAYTPYFDVFVSRSCSKKEEVSNITTQPIISSAVDKDVILIGKAPKSFIVT